VISQKQNDDFPSGFRVALLEDRPPGPGWRKTDFPPAVVEEDGRPELLYWYEKECQMTNTRRLKSITVEELLEELWGLEPWLLRGVEILEVGDSLYRILLNERPIRVERVMREHEPQED
jgi:hypothetical protein